MHQIPAKVSVWYERYHAFPEPRQYGMLSATIFGEVGDEDVGGWPRISSDGQRKDVSMTGWAATTVLWKTVVPFVLFYVRRKLVRMAIDWGSGRRSGEWVGPTRGVLGPTFGAQCPSTPVDTLSWTVRSLAGGHFCHRPTFRSYEQSQRNKAVERKEAQAVGTQRDHDSQRLHQLV